MKTRCPGLDLLRCLGLLFVNGIHAFLYNGFYAEPQTGAAIWAADCFRWLFFCCNGIFMTLTGYLKCEKPLNRAYYRSLLPILTGYVLTCAVSFPIRHFLIGEKLSLLEWLEKLVAFGNYGWYVEMYLGLILFCPVINLVLERMTQVKQYLWLAGTMVLLTALPSITPLNLIPDYWEPLYPVTYYVLGAVIRKLSPKIRPWICLTMAGITVLLMGFFSVVSTDANFSDGFGQGYGGFWVTMLVVWLFLGLYQAKISPRVGKVLSWMAGGCFEGYMLSRLFDVWIYNTIPAWHVPAMYPLLFLCVTVPVFFASVLAGKAVHTLTLRLCRRFLSPAPAQLPSE